MNENIKHNFRQYLGKECPYCNGKVKRIVVDEEPAKQCKNCGRILKRLIREECTGL